MGWNLPPGVTDRMIDEAAGGCDEPADPPTEEEQRAEAWEYWHQRALKSEAACKRAFELGAIAMRQLAAAKCGNLTESLQEGVMTDAGLTRADKRAMNHQVVAINEVEKDIRNCTVERAAHYGSYILSEREQAEIKALFPSLSMD